MITANIDGLAEPRNPGTGTYGYVIYEGKKKLAEGEGLAGYEVTNNYAEYAALVEVLRKLKELRAEADIVIRSDSRLLVGQMSKGWGVRGGGYLGKLKEARDLLKEFGSVAFEWIPREQNKEADLLSRIAYEKHRKE
ncbi:MAG: reverse transcriptase-like protein [Nitrososphaerales archaeon]